MASGNFFSASRKSMAMGPTVRNLLNHYQLDPAQISSTGPHKMLLKSDVANYISQHKLQPKQAPHHGTSGNQGSSAPKTYSLNLDISGYQPKAGPEGFSTIAKQLLGR